jgi:hypothetical protein
MKALGDGRHLATDLGQETEIDPGHAAAGTFLGMADAGPFAVEPVGAVRAVGVARGEFLFEMSAEVRLHAIDLGAAEQAFVDQAL